MLYYTLWKLFYSEMCMLILVVVTEIIQTVASLSVCLSLTLCPCLLVFMSMHTQPHRAFQLFQIAMGHFSDEDHQLVSWQSPELLLFFSNFWLCEKEYTEYFCRQQLIVKLSIALKLWPVIIILWLLSLLTTVGLRNLNILWSTHNMFHKWNNAFISVQFLYKAE